MVMGSTTQAQSEMTMKHTFDYVTLEATTDAGMSLKNRLRFHYFNPHGLCAAKREQDSEINNLIDSGAVPAGWYIAYGSMSHFESDRLGNLTMRKSTPSRIKVQVAISMLRKHVEHVASKIAEAKNKQAA